MSKTSEIKALYINTSLKRQPDMSHTRLLLNASAAILENQDVEVEHLHLAQHCVPPGIYPDMTEHGYETDDWLQLWKKIKEANILVIGTPIWLGEESSICRILIERLYAMSSNLNNKGQSIFYGKVGACVITGNEDGIKHTAMTITYALNHLGVSIPPQADCGWIGEAGPGASYGDEAKNGKRVGFDNEFTQKNTTIMTWNCLHLARILAERSGYPNEGNDREAWQQGERFGYKNPDACLEES